MHIPSGKRVKVNVWEKGISFIGKVKKWDLEEVVICQVVTNKEWTFPYQDIIKGKVMISTTKAS